MEIKNLALTKKVCAMALAGTLTATSLSGCNHTIFRVKRTFNKAIIMKNDSVMIVDVKKWTDFDGGQILIKTEEGVYILTSLADTKLIDDRHSEIKAEDIAKSIMGEDVEIHYANREKIKSK